MKIQAAMIRAVLLQSSQDPASAGGTRGRAMRRGAVHKRPGSAKGLARRRSGPRSPARVLAPKTKSIAIAIVQVALIIDVFAGRIVGWLVSTSMTMSFVFNALD